MIVARYIRISPMTWSVNGPGLRLNYIGCFSLFYPTPRPTLPAIFEESTVITVSPTPHVVPPLDVPGGLLLVRSVVLI